MKGDEPKEIRRERVVVDTNLTVKEIMEKYGTLQSTATNAKKRGWFVKNYSKKQILIDRDNFNPAAAYNLAGKVFWKNFAYKYSGIALQLKEDLVQEAVVRLFELSGKKSNNPKYSDNYAKFYIAHNAMLSFLKTYLKQTRHQAIWRSVYEIVMRNPRLAPLLELA